MATSLHQRRGSCPTPGRWQGSVPCGAPHCPSSQEASTGCRQEATKLRKSKPKTNGKEDVLSPTHHCPPFSSSELSSHGSGSPPPAATAACSSRRGSPLCFLRRLFLFLTTVGTDPTAGSFIVIVWVSSANDAGPVECRLVDRVSSLGMGEVMR